MSTRQRPALNSKLNVLVITPDQMRADHLHCYGYPRKTSPHIDEIAREGVLFKRHYSVAPWTTPSFCSIMSSLVPSRHGATLFGSSIENSNIPLLSEQFKVAGYRTVAFCNNALASKPLNRGFDELYEGEKEWTQTTHTEHMEFGAQGTNKQIFNWLSKNYGESFFMWILYFEPHSPYNPPRQHDIFKTTAYPNEMNNGYTPEKNSGYLYRLANAGDEKAVERLNSLYDGKIHFVDYHVGRILQKLKELNIDGKTLVVFTSDHGELLYEHDDCLTFDHCSLYDSVLQVPLILRGAMLPKGKSIDALVSTLDIAPTILEIAGLPVPNDMQGKSLIPLINNNVTAIHEHIFAEQDIIEQLRSVRNYRYKLIRHLQRGKSCLYDTLADPHEQKDIISKNSEIASTLSIHMDNYLKRNQLPEEKKLRRMRQISSDLKEIIIDEVTPSARLQFLGMSYCDLSHWVGMSDGGDNYHNACYWIRPGDGSKGALWRSENPLLGIYDIYIWYGRIPQRRSATNAHFSVYTRGGSRTFIIDQNKNRGKWNLLGRFENPLYVKVTNNADGPVVIDAAKFELVNR